MICRNHEQRECGSADMDVWQASDPLDPIKLKAAGVIWFNNSLVTFLLTTSSTRDVLDQQPYL